MAEKILKYGLFATQGEHLVALPLGARILAVQYQGTELMLWAQVDPSAPAVNRTFRFFWTGREIDADGFEHVATVQDPLAGLVWHVFAEIWPEIDGIPVSAVVPFPVRSAPTEIRPSTGPDRLRCLGVSRYAHNPQAVAVSFSRPLTDAELRVFHDACRQAAGIVEAAGRPDESQP